MADRSAPPVSAGEDCVPELLDFVPMMRHLNVTLSGERAPSEVAADLARAGMQIEYVLEAIGVITGEAESGREDALRGILGVADVSGEPGIDIGPPGEDLGSAAQPRPKV